MIESAWKSLCAEHNFYLSSVLSIFSDKIFDAQKQRCFLKLKFMEALTILKWLKWLRWWQNKAQRLYKSNLSVGFEFAMYPRHDINAAWTYMTANQLRMALQYQALSWQRAAHSLHEYEHALVSRSQKLGQSTANFQWVMKRTVRQFWIIFRWWNSVQLMTAGKCSM